MDQIAAELGMDPLEVRRRNFIPADDFPHETALGIVYDSGNYQGTLDKLLEHVDVDGVPRASRRELRQQGIYRGIGFSTYIEICGLAPSRVVGPQRRRPAGRRSGSRRMVRVHASGSATVYTGTSPHGQGHETGFAQIVGRPARASTRSRSTSIHGDTDQGPCGLGHLRLALAGRRRRGGRPRGREGRRQGQARSCAHLLEAAPEDIELRDGKFTGHAARPTRAMTLAEVAGAAYVPREPARRHGARARGDVVLRPGELRLPVRRARVRRRRRRRDRQGRGRALRRGRRLRPGDQPDADRRPGPRRHRARDRPGALRAGRSTTRTASS